MQKLLLVILCTCLLYSCTTREVHLYKISKERVTEYLKRPDGVVFDEAAYSVKIVDSGDQFKGIVTGGFKSPNVFGVKERHIYQAIFYCLAVGPKGNKEPNEQWHCTSILFDNDIIKANQQAQAGTPAGTDQNTAGGQQEEQPTSASNHDANPQQSGETDAKKSMLDDEARFGPTKTDIEILSMDATSPGEGIRYINVKVHNRSRRLASFVNLKVLFYDKDNKLVGTGTGATANIASNADKVIKCVALHVDNDATYTVEVDQASFYKE